jgi:hypothetical protein
MEQIRRSKTPKTSRKGDSSNELLYELYDLKLTDKTRRISTDKTRPKTSQSVTLRCSSSMYASSRNKSAFSTSNSSRQTNISLLRYEPAVVSAIKPKSLVGPYNLHDVPYMRDIYTKYRVASAKQHKNDQVSKEFYDDLKFEEYFSKKSNWSNKSKFLSTYSLYSAVQVYLPLKSDRNLSDLTRKYIELQKTKHAKPRMRSDLKEFKGIKENKS